MEAIPGAAVLFCFVLFWAGAERQVWSGVRWQAECGCDGRWNVVLPGSAGQRMVTDDGKQWQGGRYDAVARTLGN